VRWIAKRHPTIAAPPVTASLDAAVAFVERALPGCNWCLTKDKPAELKETPHADA
jgi:hypothetical protein